MPDRDQIVAAIQTYCRAETEKDRESFMALFAEDVVHEDPVGAPSGIRRGPEGIADLWSLVVRSDVHLWLTGDVIVCGDEAIALMACETGPAEKRRRSGQIVDVFRFNEAGKVVGVRAFYHYG